MDFLSNPNLNNVAALATAATKVLVVDGASNTVKTNTPAQIVAGLDGDKGDITVSASGATWTIDNDVVTYAKMQNVSATNKVLGRSSLGAGDVQEIDCTAAGRAIIGAADAASQRTILELVSIATTGSASDLGTGTIPDARFPALTGDVTSTAGTVSTTIAANAVTTTKIANDNVTYAKIQNVTASKILGRKTNTNGDVEECSLSEVLDLVGSAAQGDILYRGASTWTRLGAGTSGQYLKTQGSGANPVWADVSGSGNKSFQATLLGGMPNSNDAIYMADNGGGWGWPDSGSLTQADSLLKASKFVVPFKPANYRFSALCYSAPTYWVGTTPTAGDFGIKFQYSANNSTWTDIDTLFLKGKAVGDIASANGTLSIGGTDTLFYIRVVFVNTLSSQASGVNMQLTTLVANFWN